MAVLLYRVIGAGAFLVAALAGLVLLVMVVGDASWQERAFKSIELSLEVLVGLVAFGNADRLERKHETVER